MPGPQVLIVDTNVIIDVFVRGHDARYRSSVELLREVEAGRFLGILPAPVLIEIFYIVLDMTHDPKRAQRVLGILLGSSHFVPVDIEVEHALLAIDYYERSNYFRRGHGKAFKRDEGLSMVDCLILAVGRSIPRSIVCTNEGRFLQIKEVAVRRPYELVGEVDEGAASTQRTISAGRPSLR